MLSSYIRLSNNLISLDIRQSIIARITLSSEECIKDHIILSRVGCLTVGIGPFSRVIVQKLILKACPKKIFLMRFNIQNNNLVQINEHLMTAETKGNVKKDFLKWCKREKYISSGSTLELEGKLYRCCFNKPFNHFGSYYLINISKLFLMTLS